MSAITREWATVEEHVADALSSRQQEETVSSPFTAALGAVQHQAAALESDALGNPLSVVLAARHVGRSFSYAECVALADFIAALEAEKRGQVLASEMAGERARLTGPQQVLQ